MTQEVKPNIKNNMFSGIVDCKPPTKSIVPIHPNTSWGSVFGPQKHTLNTEPQKAWLDV